MNEDAYYGQKEFDEDEVRLCTANDLVFSIQKRPIRSKNPERRKICEEGEFAWYENAFSVPPRIHL